MGKTIHFYYRGEKIFFLLPNVRDDVQAVVNEYKTFYESVMLEDMAKKVNRGGVVVDVGAYFGNHSIFLAKFTGSKVISFEPSPRSYKLFNRNIKLNNLENLVTSYNLAVGKENGRGDVDEVSVMNQGMNRVIQNPDGQVKIVKLDDFLNKQKIECIKIDVEGMELNVLKGAEKILKKYKPLVYVEIADPQDRDVIKKYLGTLGYSMKKTFNATPTYLFSAQKLKVGFWAANDNFKFLEPIITELQADYDVKVFKTSSGQNLREEIESVDVAWFEWANGPLIEASNLLGLTTPIICRLHRFEAYRADLMSAINWGNVTKLIVVAGFIKEEICSKIPALESKIVVIENGVDLERWKYRVRKPGHKIAFLGGFNSVKDPRLLLLAFQSLLRTDDKLELHFAGPNVDEITHRSTEYLTKELFLEKNVIFYGTVDNVDEWLEDKNYILCTSIIESQGLSVMEAMSKGIKPVIYNFFGAKTIYDPRYLFSDFEELKKVFSTDYDSKEYRGFVESKYELKAKVMLVKSALTETVESFKPQRYLVAGENVSRLRQKVRLVVPFRFRKIFKFLVR